MSSLRSAPVELHVDGAFGHTAAPGVSRRRLLLGAAGAAAMSPFASLALPGTADAAVVSRPARSADELANLLGVVVVTSSRHGVWGKRDLVKSRMQELGARFIRNRLFEGNNGQIQYLRELGQAGIRANLVMGDPTMRGGTPERLVQVAAEQLGGAVASFEGANEWNLKGRSNWVRELRDHQARLYRAANRDPRTSGVPVLAPSLGMRKDADKLGNLTPYLDYGNIHLYTGGFAPGYRVDEELGDIRAVSGSKPVMVTETGWHNAQYTSATHNYTSEAVAGVYAPRLMLEYFIRRVPRIFIYHLVDERSEPAQRDHEAHFGLLRNDFSRKPAFNALANMQQLLRGGRSSNPGSLAYEVRNAPRDMKQALVRRADGTFVLFLWRDVSIWDPSRESNMRVGSVGVTVALSGAASVRAYRPSTGNRAVASSARASSLSVSLGADVVALEIS